MQDVVSAGQLNVSFGQQELDLLEELRAVSKRTGIPTAVIAKRAMLAVLNRDEELFEQLASFATPAALGPAERVEIQLDAFA